MATFNVNSQSNVTVTATDDDDTINLTGQGSNILINALAGSDQVVANGGAIYTASTVFGGLGNDTLGGGFGSFSLVFGNQGADTITLTTGGSRVTAFGGQDNDTITGANGGSQQLIFGNQGNDVIDLTDLGTGSSVYGGQGNDSITGGNGGGQLLSGDIGNDTITSSGNRDTLNGGTGRDTLTITGNADLVNGNADDDSFFVTSQGSTVFGGQGSDTIVVNAFGGFDEGSGGTGGSGGSGGSGGTGEIPDFSQAAIVIDATESNLIFGNLGDDTITLNAGVGGTTVYGGQGADIITVATDDEGSGGSSNNVIYGDLGNDIITVGAAEATTVFGGQGDDRITGTDVNDAFDGGAGRDIFVATGTNTFGGDDALTINNFVSGEDLVALSDTVPATNANYAEAQVVGGLDAARAAAQGIGANQYLFVAGSSDGYLFFGSTDVVVELNDLNNIDLFAASDITLGAGVGDTGATQQT